MKKFVLVVLSVLFVSLGNVQAQSSGGMQVYAGYLAGMNSNSDFTPEGIRGGYLIGADARLLGGDMYFIFGGRYNVMAINGTTVPGISSDSYGLFTGRIGLGFTIFNVSRNIRLRSKFVGSIHFINTIDQDKIENQRFRNVNDSFGGVTTGLGADIGIFTVDLEYEFGLINSVFNEPDTKLNFITLTGGVKF